MQKTFVDADTQTEPQILAHSNNGDYSRKTRVLFAIVGAGTIWVDNKADVTSDTGIPFSEGVYGSDEGLWSNETLYAVASDGEEVDVRIMIQGAGGTIDDSADDA